MLFITLVATPGTLPSGVVPAFSLGFKFSKSFVISSREAEVKERAYGVVRIGFYHLHQLAFFRRGQTFIFRHRGHLGYLQHNP